jgi:hypothetical protein
MTPLYFLCPRCRTAWTALVAASCCGTRPIDCSPWSSDARTWLKCRLGERARGVWEAAHYRTTADHRESLRRGAEARGNRVEMVA